MRNLVALLTFAFAGSASPGPNNALLWASGMRFGFTRTLPHVLGTILGLGALLVAVAIGLGAVLRVAPGAQLVLKVGGSAYLLYLAYLVAGSGAVGRAETARPLGMVRGLVFQCANPKAWVFAVAAVGTFLTEASPATTARFVAIVVAVVGMSSAIWAAGGAALGRMLESERSLRTASAVLGVLVVASVVLIWI
jgi:threonine/homoserine/homoserine lactone efflux protein